MYMTYVQIACGFTGAMTLMFLWRSLLRKFGTIPSLSVHFSPRGGCTETVVAEIGKARSEILVLAYSFSSKPIAEALIEAKKRGVHVEIILDKSNEVETYSDLHLFAEQGLAPLVDAHHAIAHNKVMVIDKKTLITGSFNFTHQAEAENGENLLVIKGQPDLIALYRGNFTSHKEHSRQPEQKAPHQRAA